MPRVGSAFAAKSRAPGRRAEAAPDFAPDFSGPYEPQALEPDLYAAWEKAGAFAPRPRAKARRGCRGYGISLPPPNVTGSLHMGHALNASLQDILVRFARMQGEAVLWQPGTDHAGIATQLVVEKQLAARGESRKDLGRKRFEEEVWKWKDESGSQILTQLKRLGASCDWGRERFTMDAHFARTVRQLFVRLYRAGLV
ncbi:MAG: class I tRNA ligase family protein, partial [Hyphomicrobiales bacterium]|nr:class I tRNA ligase family protein [Hyphomicrobiales bacterium]